VGSLAYAQRQQGRPGAPRRVGFEAVSGSWGSATFSADGEVVVVVAGMPFDLVAFERIPETDAPRVLATPGAQVVRRRSNRPRSQAPSRRLSRG
jgi:hypothetical protein